MAISQAIVAAALVITSAAVVTPAREQGRGGAPAAAQPAAPAAVGVVCEGGLLMPIAVHTQDAWRSLTEKADAGAPLTLSREATSLPRVGWTIIPFDVNVASRALTLVGAALLDDSSVCNDQEGFRTDAPTNARSRRPTDFIGIAIMGRVTVERVETVQHLPDPASRRVGTLVIQLVQALEAERVDALPAGTPWPSASQRSRTPVDLDNMWRYRYGGNDWYYFEAEKDYSNDGDTGNTFVKGWIVAAASGADASLVRVRVSVGDIEDGVTLEAHALGVLRVEDRAVWILDERTYEGRNFQLVEIPTSQKLPACILHEC